MIFHLTFAAPPFSSRLAHGPGTGFEYAGKSQRLGSSSSAKSYSVLTRNLRKVLASINAEGEWLLTREMTVVA